MLTMSVPTLDWLDSSNWRPQFSDNCVSLLWWGAKVKHHLIIISVSMTHRPPGFFLGIWDMKVGKIILSNFCSCAAILIFFVWLQIKILCPITLVQSCDLREKMLRIVFPNYKSFFGSQIPKKVFSRGPVCEMFSTNVNMSANNNKKKSGAIKQFLIGSKIWLKDVGSILTYRQKCAILPDQPFVFLKPKV